MKSSIIGSLGLQRELVLLAPLGALEPRRFTHTEVNESFRASLLTRMQRFRGGVYLEDGAIQPEELTADGRHVLEIDEQSWHLLMLNRGDVCGCVRIVNRTEARNFGELWIRNSALSRPAAGCGDQQGDSWSDRLRRAVELEMARARRERIWFAEVGGLAIAADRRCTTDSLRVILATFAFLELCGGSRCVATVTSRHNCAPILKRIGLSSLMLDGVELPPYFDPQFHCEMQVLRFDSRFPNPKYARWVLELGSYLSTVPVIAGAPEAPLALEASPWYAPPARVDVQRRPAFSWQLSMCDAVQT